MTSKLLSCFTRVLGTRLMLMPHYVFLFLPKKCLSDEDGGLIDRVAQDLFSLLGEKRKNNGSLDATVRMSYMELHREELRDLLELHTMHKELHIREDERGNTGNLTLWQNYYYLLTVIGPIPK